MTELKWRLKTTGTASLDGAVPNPTGAVRIHPQVPAGTLQEVTAQMPWSMADDEWAFFNGYQTWTYCPEYKKTDKLRGLNHVPQFLLRKFAFDRYGDYHFMDYPEKAGYFHGFSYCYLRRGKRFRLIASLDERPGYTIFRYNANAGLLEITRDCAGVAWSGGELPAFDLFFAEGTEDAVFDGWFAALGIKPRTTAPLAGYSSWYNRYEHITQETIRADLSGCQALLQPGDLFQIDDGWEPHVGDWLVCDDTKFPDGISPLVDQIHAAGFQAGLWVAPFVCERNSAIFREHPDWLLQVDGQPWQCGCNWSGFYGLDIDHPAVLDYLKAVFDRILNQWGFDLVKLDFLYGVAPFGSGAESRAGRMYRAMELLRSWCGEKRILACGVPVMPAFGLVDYCRVGCDVSLNWDDKWYMRRFHRERVSTRQSIGNTVFRRQLNGRAYGSDPDVFFLRDTNLKLSPAQKEALATVNGLFGQVLLTSDDPSQYGQSAKARYRALLRLRDAEDICVEHHNGLQISYTLEGKRQTLSIE